MELTDFFQQYPSAALAFSGGVDSAYLLHAARAAGAVVQPYFLKTPFQPAFELDDALRLAPELIILELDVLSCPEIAANTADRCYRCKKLLFSHLIRQAQLDGYPVVLDGTNASDAPADRPGMRALDELGILSPLRLCGLEKEEIRRRSRQAGLFTWNKPAYACLATRIPTDTPIDASLLHRIEAAESALLRLGYTDFRVRVFHGAARLQLPQEQFPTTAVEYQALREVCLPYFQEILLDLKSR